MVGFESQVRLYPVIISALKACSEDICVKCIGLESAKIKTEKGLKKMKIEVGKSTAATEEKKKQLMTKLDSLLAAVEGISLAESCSCQKTAESCFIPGCTPKFIAEELPKVLTTA